MSQLTALQIKMAVTGYEDKVPEDLKQANREKLESLVKIKGDLDEALANFERLAALEHK
jgi:hypothetical protein